MSEHPAETAELLQRWHGGDAEALAALVERDLPWIRMHVSRRLGRLLRRRADTNDVLQQTMLEVLRCGPRFVLDDLRQFRALLARMVENVLRNEHDRQTAARRDLRREESMPSTVIHLDRPAPVTEPSVAAENAELRVWMRLALEFLDPQDRDIILMREYQSLTFADIGTQLGIPEKTANRRFQRALPKLAEKLQGLRRGGLHAMLELEAAP